MWQKFEYRENYLMVLHFQLGALVKNFFEPFLKPNNIELLFIDGPLH